MDLVATRTSLLRTIADAFAQVGPVLEPRAIFRWSRASGGGWQLSQIMKTWPPPEFSPNRWTMENLSALEQFLHEVSPHFLDHVASDFTGGGGSSSARGILTEIATEVWRRGGTQPNASTVESVVDEALRFFIHPVAGITILIPLHHFVSAIGRADLVNDDDMEIWIGALSEEDVNYVVNGQADLMDYKRDIPALGVFAKVSTTIVRDSDGRSPSNVKWNAYRTALARALRLLRPGTGRIGHSHYRWTTWVPMGPATLGVLDGEPESAWGRYQLDPGDIPKLKQLCDDLLAEVPTAVDLAIRRLQFAVTREMPADSLVDAVVGLEALLLSGIKSELGFRFALNYALLGPLNERQDRLALAKKMYEARSQLLHGVTSQSIKQDADNAIEMLRRTLDMFVSGEKGTRPSPDDAFWKKLQLGLV